MRMRVALRGAPELREKLARTGENAVDLQPAWRHITDVIVDAEQRRFAQFPFKPLHDSTIRRKRRAGMSEPAKPLVGTGRLRASLTRHGDPDQNLDITPDYLRFGSRLFYIRFHGERPPLVYTAAVKGKANRTIRNFLTHGIATDRRV